MNHYLQVSFKVGEMVQFSAEHFLDFCLMLTENTLRSFRYGRTSSPSALYWLTSSRWEIGACVPLNILGRNGYLTQHQTRLENIALITDGACDENLDGDFPYNLANFVNIRSFAWTGLQSRKRF